MDYAKLKALIDAARADPQVETEVQPEQARRKRISVRKAESKLEALEDAMRRLRMDDEEVLVLYAGMLN